MQSYQFKALPFEIEINYNKIAKQLLLANASVSKFDGMLEETSINKELFLNPLTKKEAVLSSKIEGTQATLTEFLEIEADNGKSVSTSMYDDFIEIMNNLNKSDYIRFVGNGFVETTNKGKTFFPNSLIKWVLNNILAIIAIIISIIALFN